MIHDTDHPHQGQPVINKGKPLEKAKGVVILLHGRGATAESILTLAIELQKTGDGQTAHQAHGGSLVDLAWMAPQASFNTWYPYSFLSPPEQNEPGLSSVFQVIEELIDQVTEAGILKKNIVLAGFSQGACLASEFAARNPDRYGGVVALSGGLMGPEVDPGRYSGSMEGTPVFFGCSDYDHYIPEERVHESAELFERIGADVTKKIYEGLGHTVNKDEFRHFHEILTNIGI